MTNITTGLCADPAVLARTGPVWTSDSVHDREIARQICGSCPVSQQCLEWSVTSVPSSDNAIYAGANAAERRSIRRSRRAA